MNKKDLIDRTGLSWKVLAKMKKGETVTTETIMRICDALDCQPGDIMEFTRNEGSKNKAASEKKSENSRSLI